MTNEKEPTPYRAAKAALRAACDDAYRRGREDEQRPQDPKPCALGRIQRGAEKGHDAVTAYLLMAAVSYASMHDVDMSKVAADMANQMEANSARYGL